MFQPERFYYIYTKGRGYKAIADNYRRLMLLRFEQELQLVESKATGNIAASEHHRILSEVYRLMLDGRELPA